MERFEHRGEPGTTGDRILEEHVEKALTRTADPTARYHLRAALQRFELE